MKIKTDITTSRKKCSLMYRHDIAAKLHPWHCTTIIHSPNFTTFKTT